MAAAVSHKLSNAFEGALAGGGDPATSPLYVFGPFLSLIVVGAATGVADVTFGPTVWLVVFTIIMVSAMYRLVMRWVTDGSGGSGLSEEEFGPWAVKINAGITFVEYTLTFLVSMSALVTFIADRSETLRHGTVAGIEYRVFIAIVLSIATAWLVNRGPKASARFFGPATLAVLGLLWAMILSTLARHFGYFGGFPGGAEFGILPGFDLQAFSFAPTDALSAEHVAAIEGINPELVEELELVAGESPGSFFHFTLGGYVRILAVMTGIEVFANLVAAYGGSAEEKAKKAFGSLIIIMGTAAATMLVVGPAMFRVAQPADPNVSVFTQTMDQLLPWTIPGIGVPVGTIGTLIGIAVLLSASAASAQGLQNLFLGLSTRNYVPSRMGRPNDYGVADAPVWLETAICCVTFLLFGAEEHTYLAIYAAGVFILLSMTGWAAAKRLIRELKRHGFDAGKGATLFGAVASAILTSVATVIIFFERFAEGAWTYLVFIPLLYVGFTYFRKQLGEPSAIADRLGEIEEAALGGFGPGQRDRVPVPEVALPKGVKTRAVDWPALPAEGEGWRKTPPAFAHLMVPLDGSDFAERALPMARNIVRAAQGKLTLMSVLQGAKVLPGSSVADLATTEGPAGERAVYLESVAKDLREAGFEVDTLIVDGHVAPAIRRAADMVDADGIILSSHGRSGLGGFLMGANAKALLERARHPVIMVRPNADGSLSDPQMDTMVVALDGSTIAEAMLPYARTLAKAQNAELVLVTVLEVPQAEDFGLLADVVADLRAQAETGAKQYLDDLVGALTAEGLRARGVVHDTSPARAIIREMNATDERGLAMLTSHGRSGLGGAMIGSVAARVARYVEGEVFLLPSSD